MTIEFRLLGDVCVLVDGRAAPIGPARQRCVLAALLVDVDRVVSVDQLVDRVWDDRPPGRVRMTLSGYVSRLRHLLGGAGIGLGHEAGGYRLRADPRTVDLHRFRHLVAEARRSEGDVLAGYEEALGLWRGEAFGGLESPWLTSARNALNAERLAVELDRNDLALDRGLHATLLPELSLRAAEYPWDERLFGQLMLALYRSGRPAEALSGYHELRQRLDEEMGAYPGVALQQLHKQILTADPALDASPEPVTRVVPRQLPPAAPAFTGRKKELDRLDEIAAWSDTPGAVVISALSGTAGVGKTALAVHWSHSVADQFIDGQLYVNLRGFDPGGTQVSVGAAIQGFLSALDVLPERIPDGLDERTALYRSIMADRRMLIVLDNARDAAHVRPLLPASPGSMALVTSRNLLTGLVVAEGAQLVTLDLLEPAEARELLVNRLGRARVEAEPAAVAELIERCARLPLALSIVAAHAAVHPDFPMSTLAEQLRHALDTLASGDSGTDLRAVFSWSYATLTPAAARLFRLLGVHPGPDITVPIAASLAGTPVAEARRLLAELAQVQLVGEYVPGRYASHDLLRAYAAELAGRDRVEERHGALRRVLSHYLHTAYHASRLIHPNREPIELPPPEPGVGVERFADDDRALAWFEAERIGLLNAAGRAVEAGLDELAQLLPLVLGTFFNLRGLWREMAVANRIALAAAERRGDEPAQAFALRGLARALGRLGDFEPAHETIGRARAMTRRLGYQFAEGQADLCLSEILGRQERYAEAIPVVEHALAIFRAIGHQLGQGQANNRIGWYHALLGDYHRTLEYCERALALQQGIQDRLAQVATWDSLGFAHHHLGEYQRAITCYERAFGLAREIGDRCTEAEVLAHIGDVRLALDEREAARQAWQASVVLLEAIHHPAAETIRTKLRGAGEGR